MRRLVVMAMVAAAATGCLPADERPQPGRVFLNVQRSVPVIEGFVTDDGWQISFERFVLALGGGGVRGGDCVDYSLSAYSRLYDFTAADTSKLVLHYGLGQCEIVFARVSPEENTILMGGASAADLTLMSTEQADGIGEKKEEMGVSLMVRGRAEREGVTKEFSWLIRSWHKIMRCYAPGSDEVVSALALRAGETSTRELEIRPQELFRRAPSPDMPIEFERFAAADADEDGSITLDELNKVTVPLDEIVDHLTDELRYWDRDQIAEHFGTLTLATLVYDILAWRVTAFAGAGECEVGVRGEDWW